MMARSRSPLGRRDVRRVQERRGPSRHPLSLGHQPSMPILGVEVWLRGGPVDFKGPPLRGFSSCRLKPGLRLPSLAPAAAAQQINRGAQLQERVI